VIVFNIMNKSINKPLATLWAIVTLSLCAGGTYLAAQSPIPAKEVIVKPAVPEKRFSAYWVRNFQARATSPTEGTYYLEVIPYNPETGELDHSAPKEFSGDLWELTKEVPEAAQAMGAVFVAVPAIEKWIDDKAAAAAAAEAAAAAAAAAE
tara:strand:+ start:5960 stop:6412 length:453 start_codon:yes stop_codon:yes gene_type:complete